MVEVWSETSVTIDTRRLRRGRIIRWTNKTPQASDGGVYVSNTGAATASNGGIANTGIVRGSGSDIPSNEDSVTIWVPRHVTRVTIKKAAHFTSGGVHSTVSDKR